MKIYLDIFFVVNFLMDYVVLWILHFYKKKRTNNLRITGLAAFMAVCSVLYLVFHLNQTIIFSFLMAILATRLLFGKQRIRELGKNIVLYLLIHFLLSGMLDFVRNVVLGGHLSLTKVLIIVTIALNLAKWGIPKILANVHIKRICIPVQLLCGEKICNCTGLIDTGNELREPITGSPVMVVSESYAQKNLPVEKIKKERGARAIPYHTVGEKRGIMMGIQVETARIHWKEQWICIENPWIALSKEELSASNEYDVILQEEFIKNSDT